MVVMPIDARNVLPHDASFVVSQSVFGRTPAKAVAIRQVTGMIASLH